MTRYFRMSAMTGVWLIGCDPGATDSVESDSTGGEDSADSADSSDTGTPPPFECPEPTATQTPLSKTAWTQLSAIPANGIVTFAGGAPGEPLYAGSHNAGFFITQNMGASWLSSAGELSTHTAGEVYVLPGEPLHVYRSAGGRLEQSVDAGTTWTQTTLGEANGSQSAFVYALGGPSYDSQIVYAVMDDGTFEVSNDQGETWEERGLVPVGRISGTGSVWAGLTWRILGDQEAGGRIVFGDGEHVSVSNDGGETWQYAAATTFNGRSFVRDPLAPRHLLFGASDGIWESFDEGDNWTIHDVGTPVSLLAYTPDGGTLVGAGDQLLLVSKDGGQNFTSQGFEWASPGALRAFDDGTILLAWDDGVASTVNMGASWTEVNTGLDDPGMSVVAPHPDCDNLVFTASRCSGGIFSSDDWGQSWAHVLQQFHYVMAIHYAPGHPDHVFAVNDDELLESWDSGQTWTMLREEFHFHGFAVNPGNANELLLGSVGSGEWPDTSMTVYRSEDAGATWTKSGDGLPQSLESAHTIAYWPKDTSVVILGTYRGGGVSHTTGTGVGMFRSADGGLSWTAIDAPVKEIAWLSPNAETMWAATDDGVYSSCDKGETWIKANGPEGFMLSVDFNDDLGLAFSQDGQAWRSADAGINWTKLGAMQRTSPANYLAQTAISAEKTTGYVTVYGLGVWAIDLTE